MVKHHYPWEFFLSSDRLNIHVLTDNDLELKNFRNSFQKDVDKIIFYSSFRRLGDKTQVDYLSSNDYVRNRLTHSLEVATIGRFLGDIVRNKLSLDNDFCIGDVIYAASLIHDIGNPPFGHDGEKAMSNWFIEKFNSKCINVSSNVFNDYLNFDGNAQGFRIITQSNSSLFNDGLGLTFAVLGTFVKYPYGFLCDSNFKYKDKPFGVFSSELPLLNIIAEKTGMILLSRDGSENLLEKAWARHPLNFLMEAADDICYHIVDIEDAFKQKKLSFKIAEDLLSRLISKDDSYKNLNQDNKIIYLRAKSIEKLSYSVASEFVNNYDLILSGKYNKKLCNDIPEADIIAKIRSFSQEFIYPIFGENEAEFNVKQILETLMDFYLSIWFDPSINPSLFEKIFTGIEKADSHDEVIRSIFDYVAGMTDSFAIREFHKHCNHL